MSDENDLRNYFCASETKLKPEDTDSSHQECEFLNRKFKRRFIKVDSVAKLVMMSFAYRSGFSDGKMGRSFDSCRRNNRSLVLNLNLSCY